MFNCIFRAKLQFHPYVFQQNYEGYISRYNFEQSEKLFNFILS